MELLPLLEFGSNGLVFAIVLAAFKTIELKKAKSNGGTLSSRLTILESRVFDLRDRKSVV